MLSLKWWNRLRLASVSLPIFFIISLASSCSSSKDRVHSGVPSEAAPGSFVVTMNPTSGGQAAQQTQLSTLAKEIGENLGCAAPRIEALAWAQSAVTQTLASRFHVQFPACALDRAKLENALIAFQEREEVASVEADAIVRISEESDPLKPQEYHLARINRDAACQSLKRDKLKQVIVAVIDTGVDANHPDLSPNLLRDAQGRVIGANFVGKGARGAPDQYWNDGSGHGSHVAGLIGAAANNAQGVVGVASCASIKVMPVRVLDNAGKGATLEIERGVQWAVANGADIINLSLGVPIQFGSDPRQHKNPIYDDAVKQGIVIFAAAGNEGLNLGNRGDQRIFNYSYPAAYDSVISVAATDSLNQLAKFSNRGQTVDIAVPGDKLISTIRGGTYGLMSGTSMASPVAAGAYALVLSATRQSGSDRLRYEQLAPYLAEAKSSQILNRADVASGGILDTKLLLDIVQKKWKGTPPQAISPRQETPTTLPSNSALHFDGLISGTTVMGPVEIALSGWRNSYTTRIYISWIPEGSLFSFPFTWLTAQNLTSDNKQVKSFEAYYLFGEGKLVATGVDSMGSITETAEITLRGI